VSCLDAGGSAIGASPPMLLLNMSLRSKPLLQCRSCEPCFALMQAAPNSVMSLRSKPLLLLRPTRLCLALMLAVRRSGSSTPPRKNRACRGPPGLGRLSVPVIASLQTAFAFQLSSGIAAFLHCGSARKSAAPPYPVPWQSACATHSFDAFGQTLNYFTSRAAAIWRYRERSGQRRRWEPS
jgi:hypothetical protein